MTASECRAFLLTALLALLSTDASAQFVRGEKACRETRGQEKVRACSDALDNPGLSRIKRAILLSLRADAYPASNEGCAAAAEDLTQALDLWPNRDFNYLQLLTNRSSVYLKCDPLDPRALADADRKVALAPGWVTHQQRGIVYFNRAEYGKAIQDFRKSLSFKVDSNTLANLGDTLNRTQQYADAIPLLTKAISIRLIPTYTRRMPLAARHGGCGATSMRHCRMQTRRSKPHLRMRWPTSRVETRSGFAAN